MRRGIGFKLFWANRLKNIRRTFIGRYAVCGSSIVKNDISTTRTPHARDGAGRPVETGEQTILLLLQGGLM